ncbi:ankyrin repeat domain-containing protein [Wolbachia endosymbiont (group A) of Alloplasta piceator]|uniref:ankyrin repeat domain-containing protein n=1 Tax=Wolbachia endosymbiont (group A) of Alloplasta piceator TaxID=3066188 RepID=UPI003341F8C7
MLYGENRTNTNGYRYQRTLDAPTQKLFKAIDDENLEDFRQALEGDADVNAFDEGYTPLMTIIMNGDDSPICLKMMMLLLQHQSLNINAQETKERSTALHLAFRMENRNFVQMLLRHPELGLGTENSYGDRYGTHRSYTPKEYIEQIGREQRKDFSHLTMEITKARKGKELLDALSSGNIYQAKRLLNQELNPNCWKRTYNEEIETPLSLIIESCLRGITQDNEEVLTKLLKHKDLDFSQIKPIQDIEKNPWVKQIIEQAIKERLTGTINRKDLDDVKELVKDNCFINRAIVTAALRNVDNPIESIKNYLNEKFPASVEQPVANTNNIPAGFERAFQEVVIELEKIKAQLAETEQELDSAKQEKLSQQARISALTNQVARLTEERDRLSSENRRLCTESLSNKNEKPSQAISPGKKQSNYASAAFVLSGAFAVGACLAVLYDYPVIGACLTAVALVLLLVGYFLYKGDEKDIGPGSATDNPRVTRVLASSPNFVGNSYTY